MKQQTPLRNAIAKIEICISRMKEKIKTETDASKIAGYGLTVLTFELVLDDVLVPLLPEERRVIEEAYNNGSNDMGSSEFGGCPKHLNGNDFFTSNFEQ